MQRTRCEAKAARLCSSKLLRFLRLGELGDHQGSGALSSGETLPGTKTRGLPFAAVVLFLRGWMSDMLFLDEQVKGLEGQEL